jgi:hypothetical protein
MGYADSASKARETYDTQQAEAKQGANRAYAEGAPQREVQQKMLLAQQAGLKQGTPEFQQYVYGIKPVGSDAPADTALIQNYKFRMGLPEDQRAAFDSVQRASPEYVAAAAQARAAGTGQGKWDGGAEQRNVGKERLSDQLKGMVGNYLTLKESGGIVDPDASTMQNLQARARASAAGQAIGGAVGSPEQSIRNQINNTRPLLMQGIMQASGMSARAMDSNKELDFYLRAASDPSQDIYSNLVAIDVLDKTYGLGNVLEGSVPPEIMARVRKDADRAIQSRPIPQTQDMPPQGQQAQPQQAQPPVPGARQAPDGNFYVPDPYRPGKYLKVE